MMRASAVLRLNLLGVFLFAGAGSALAADDVWAVLKKPGQVILLRHSNAPGNASESNDMNFKDCTIQRNLDDAGRAQAARIGNEFRKHGISKVRLISSQYCRALDTARLTKLGNVSEQRDLNQVFLANPSAMAEAGTKGRALIKSVANGPLTMLVTHVTNIQSMAGAQLDSGEFAVVHVDKNGEIVVDGKMAVP
jgi:phosphohistidine phosphatase SixA